MLNTHGLIAVLILAIINAKTAVTENDYYPGKFLSKCSISASLTSLFRTLFYFHLFIYFFFVRRVIYLCSWLVESFVNIRQKTRNK